MGELRQAPEKAQSGAILTQESVEGSRVLFAQQSDASTGFLSLNATGDANNLDFGSFRISFSYIINGNVYSSASVIGWNYSNFYIDNIGFGTEYLYRQGSSVSGTTAPLRKPMLIDIFPNLLIAGDLISPSPDASVSQEIMYYCKNNDSTSHYIDVLSLWKYIVTGGPDG